MLNLIAFCDAPLTLRKSWADKQDDYSVIAASVVVGRIMLMPKSFGDVVWFWTVTGPYLPPELLPSCGEAETLALAKAAFRKKMNGWFEWAATRQLRSVWTGGTTPEFK